MIFVTVGTHEQQFNRLVEYMDRWASEHDEEVIIQTGYSTHEPKAAKWSELLPYQEIIEIVDEARIVITHGGPSSFIVPLQIGKTPIVVPRQKKFDEHVNDHQISFCRQVTERMGTIVVVEDVEELGSVIEQYDNMGCFVSMGHADVDIKDMVKSNNANFCEKLDEIAEEMFEGKR